MGVPSRLHSTFRRRETTQPQETLRGIEDLALAWNNLHIGLARLRKKVSNIGRVRSWMGWSLLAGLIMAGFGAACGGDTGSETTGRITIYSGRNESLVEPIIQRFRDETGVQVLVKYAGTPQLAATLLEEGDRTPADIFFAQDPGGLAAVAEMLAPLPDELLVRVPQWARSPEGKWVGLSGRVRTVVYNTESLTEADMPEDIFDFVDPRWKGRIGWAPTNASFQTMVTAMRSLWGETKSHQWLLGIQKNDPKVYPKNTPIVSATASGEIEVGFVNHYYLYRFLAEEGEAFTARNYHPRAGGPGATGMVAGAGILAASERRETAEKFLAFMLSPVAQQYFASTTFEYPLVEGVQTPSGLVPLSQLNQPDISAKDLADLAGTQALLRETGILP